MEKTSDTVNNELSKSLDTEVPHVSGTEGILSVSSAKSPKTHKNQKKRKKKSKKSTKKRSKSAEGSVALKTEKDNREGVQSDMPATLDTVDLTANAESDEFKTNLSILQKNSFVEEQSTKQTTVEKKANSPNISDTSSAITNNNRKIDIKDLKDNIVYHENIERMQAEKHEEEPCSSYELDNKTKIKKDLETIDLAANGESEEFKNNLCTSQKKSFVGEPSTKQTTVVKRGNSPNISKKHESHKYNRKKRSRSKDRSRRSPKRHKRNRSHSRIRKRLSSSESSHKKDHTDNDSNGNSSSTHYGSRNHQCRSRSRDKHLDKRSRSKDLSTNSKRHRSPSCEKIDKNKRFKAAQQIPNELQPPEEATNQLENTGPVVNSDGVMQLVQRNKRLFVEDKNRTSQKYGRKKIRDSHPVSLLKQICDHSKWVTLNGVKYSAMAYQRKKKLAKMDAALVCLKGIGALK
ncbi:peptidyl-prolyl cis-trans isomerase G-like [Adelges cooleyi]|uniref:peptidyl-prolyl cis-trans isomerase G-like n=1 Tax=Adelges cooleyi TaxID=133065 RepID=UPI00217F5657|nr:peptidyl-prolyl cis-trans isomerase G-like [Adelges cooleyi]